VFGDVKRKLAVGRAALGDTPLLWGVLQAGLLGADVVGGGDTADVTALTCD